MAGSAADREARGRFAAVAAAAAAVVVAVVNEGASDWREKVLPGEAREAAALVVVVVVVVPGVLRTAGFLTSSPEVSDDRSGSASDVVLDDKPVRLAAVPGAGRAGGLFKLDAPPSVLVRVLVAVGGLDAPPPIEARGVVDEEDTVGLRAPEVVAVVVGLRGGTLSLGVAVDEGVDEGAIMRRSSGVVGVREASCASCASWVWRIGCRVAAAWVRTVGNCQPPTA